MIRTYDLEVLRVTVDELNRSFKKKGNEGEARKRRCPDYRHKLRSLLLARVKRQYIHTNNGIRTQRKTKTSKNLHTSHTSIGKVKEEEYI